jgi:hypothetical protein
MGEVRHMRWRIIILASALTLLCGASAAIAQGGYSISWWTVDGGGEISTAAGGAYALSATVGQPDAGLMLGGNYALTGGFWGQVVVPYHTYLPVTLRK